LYFNDAHEISPVQDHLGSRGGVARIKTIVDKVRMQNAQTIVVFQLDLSGGTLFGAVYKGFPLVEAFNLLPLDIANFGQHDFDFGPAETKKLISASSFIRILSKQNLPGLLPMLKHPSMAVSIPILNVGGEKRI